MLLSEKQRTKVKAPVSIRNRRQDFDSVRSLLPTCYKNGQYVDCEFGDKIYYWSCGTRPACFFEHLGGIGVSTATSALGTACSVISGIPSWPNCGSLKAVAAFARLPGVEVIHYIVVVGHDHRSGHYLMKDEDHLHHPRHAAQGAKSKWEVSDMATFARYKTA